MNYKIILIYAGHGSTFLYRRLKAFSNVHKRPDVTFDVLIKYNDYVFENVGLKLTDKPTEYHKNLFFKRSMGFFCIDFAKSVEENMVNYLKRVNNSKTEKTMLTGSISQIGPFFTRNKIEGVLAVVRHPLHAMVSYLLHQHPRSGKRFGGVNSKACADFYAKYWNTRITDLFGANIRIIRYEYAREDSEGLGDEILEAIFKDWKSSKRNYGVLKPDNEAYLKSLVKDNYFRLYEKWQI